MLSATALCIFLITKLCVMSYRLFKIFTISKLDLGHSGENHKISADKLPSGHYQNILILASMFLYHPSRFTNNLKVHCKI